ncbi:MAG: cation:proton antiporter, partial [Thermoplasmatota archaeon]
SSTALIAKMLIDTGKITTEHGEAVVGILIIEDFFVVLVLTMISPLTTDMAMDPLALVEIVVRILLLVSISLSLGLMIIPRAVDRISHSLSREAVLLASLGLCFFMVLISLAMELSVAVGAFIMGIIISQSKSVGMVSAQIRPVSTLFIAIFFVSMGMLIDPTMVVEGALQGVIIALVFMVGTLVAVSFATYVANKPAGTSLKAGLSMITMGEFSIIISKIGLDNGLLDTRFYSVVLTAVLITMLIYPLLVSRMQGVVDLFKGILPMSIKESLMAIEEIREGARKRMTASSLRAKQMKQEMKGIFVDVMIILVVIVGARIFLIVGEGLELEWIGSVWVSAGVVVAVLALSLPPLISIIRHLNGLMFLLTLCTEESGVCRFRERGSVLNIIIELNSVFIGTVLLFLLLPLIPASSHLSAPLLLASLIIAGMVALLAWRLVKAAHRRFAEAIVRGFREEE